MKKIKSVTLLKDLPDIQKGTIGLFFKTNDYNDVYQFRCNSNCIDYGLNNIQRNPDWFDIEYESESDTFTEAEIREYAKEQFRFDTFFINYLNDFFNSRKGN